MKTKKEKPKTSTEKEQKEGKDLTANQITALKVVAITCGVLSFALLMAVIGLGISHGEVPVCDGGYAVVPKNLENPAVFDDLTPKEYSSVRDFLMRDTTLNLVPFENATVNSSYIYMIDLLMPLKDAVLRHLDRGDKQPERTAKVILYRGDLTPPRVHEIHVGPLPNPTYYIKVTNPSYTTNKIPFAARPVDDIEYDPLYDIIARVSETVYPLLIESYGLSYHNCTDGVDCMDFFDIAPRGTESGQRKSWFWSFRKVEGFYLHPLGFEIQIDHLSTNTTDWRVTKVIYNGQMFYSAEDLMRAYNNNRLQKIKPSPVGFKEHLYSSYIRRGTDKTKTQRPQEGPRLVEPNGHRYQVVGSHIKYMNWDFHIRSRTSSGLQVFDIRYQNERIIYELSLQDAAVFYSGFGPTQITSAYYDNSWIMGSMNNALVPGVDCPDTAVFLDAMHVVKGKFMHIKNSICIFENNPGIPLRRHYTNTFDGGYDYYGGLVDYNLVVRTISNVWNYDYIFDYIFHLNGAIEVQASSTGYVQATFALRGELKYGYLMHNKVMADIHQHLFHYKIDLDVNGPKNRYATLDVSTETVRNSWYRDVNKTQMKFDKHVVYTELGSVSGSSNPKYDIIYNEYATSKFGAKRAFRILNFGKSEFLLEKSPETKSGRWAKYPIAVTQFKDTEEMSTSIYAQNDPWTPIVDFEKFLQNNESIVDTDIVAWVTMGVIHIPHTEDVPSTPTPGSQLKFYILPYNYFTECPAVTSSDTVRIIPKGKSDINVETYGNSFENLCVQKSVGPFKYDGKY